MTVATIRRGAAFLATLAIASSAMAQYSGSVVTTTYNVSSPGNYRFVANTSVPEIGVAAVWLRARPFVSIYTSSSAGSGTASTGSGTIAWSSSTPFGPVSNTFDEVIYISRPGTVTVRTTTAASGVASHSFTRVN